MLRQVADPRAALRQIGGNPAEQMTLRGFLVRHQDIGQPVFALADEAANPGALLVYSGMRAKAYGRDEPLKRLVDDLLNERIEQPPPWPGSELQGAWEDEGSRILLLHQVRESVWRQFLAGGFELAPHRKNTENAYLFHIEGQPRFAELVKHPCRLGQGLELHDLIRQGIDYDQTGERTRRSLELEPSFVCEVGGAPVCWSATHVGGMMGMIYTPPEHRRRGYARSLAAFQIDYMLRRDGCACALVLEGNTASEELLMSFGAERLNERLGWRTIRWPDQIDNQQL